jgi:hypothetical protein
MAPGDRNRALLVIVAGVALLVAVFAFGKKEGPAPKGEPSPASASATTAPPPRDPIAIRRPAAAIVELGVMSDRPEKEMAPLAVPSAAIALVAAKHCGDDRACDAVRALLREEGHLRLELRDAPGWRMPRESELANAASALTPKERETFAKSPRVIVVTVSGNAKPDQLPIRAGFAIAAAIAEKLGAFVYDPVLDRAEKSSQFAEHVVKEPLGASAFRRDRIDFQYVPRDEANLRAITTGMVRFGAPDLEVASAPKGILPKLVDVLAAIAKKVADGAETSPIALGLADLDRARDGGATSADESGTLEIDLLGVHPENGDPNDVMARVVPPEGATTQGYEGLVDSLFGPSAQGWEPPTPEEFRATRTRTQAALASVLTRWKAAQKDGGESAELYVQLPFVPSSSRSGDGGPDASDLMAFEWMWLEVKSFDDKSLTGALVDDPEDVPGLSKGDKVTRRRDEVSDYLLKLPDGTTETGSLPE